MSKYDYEWVPGKTKHVVPYNSTFATPVYHCNFAPRPCSTDGKATNPGPIDLFDHSIPEGVGYGLAGGGPLYDAIDFMPDRTLADTTDLRRNRRREKRPAPAVPTATLPTPIAADIDTDAYGMATQDDARGSAAQANNHRFYDLVGRP